MTSPGEHDLPSIEELTGPAHDPADVAGQLREAVGIQQPARRREPVIEGDPEAVASLRRDLGL